MLEAPSTRTPRESANRISLCQTAGVCSNSPSMIAMTVGPRPGQVPPRPLQARHDHASNGQPDLGPREIDDDDALAANAANSVQQYGHVPLEGVGGQ